MSTIVRYTACPLSRWPSSWPSRQRSSSSSSSSREPELTTMNGLDMPTHMPLIVRSYCTNSSGSSATSSVAAASANSR